MGLGILYTPPAGSSFYPTDLGAKLKAFYNVFTASTVFTDAGVTVATTGQNVQQINDQSGAGWHVDQGTSDRRPVLTVSGANRYLQFDGSDRMNHFDSAHDLVQPFGVWILLKLGSTAAQSIFDAISGATAIYVDADGNFESYSGGAPVLNHGVATTGVHLVRTLFNGASSEVQLDSNTIVTGSLGGNGLPDGFRIGSNAADNDFISANSRIYAWAIDDGTLTAGETNSLRTFLLSLPAA
jgi:hypothetical protein